MSAIVFHAEELERSEYAPRRREDITEPRIVSPAAESWQKLAGTRESDVKRMGVAAEHAPPELVDLIQRARAIIASEAPPASFDLDATAALVVLLQASSAASPLIDVVIATDGLPRAVAVYLHSHRWEALPSKAGYAAPTLGPTQHPLRPRVEPFLRAALLLADDATYAACVEIARKEWAGAHLGLKTAIAYRFPREVEWGREVARAWIDEKGPAPTYFLYACLDDLDLVTKLFEKGPVGADLMNVLAWHGERALPLVLKALDKKGSSYELKPASTAAALFECEEVAHAFAALLGKAEVRPRAAQYFARYPELGKKALPAVATGKTRVAQFAQELLGQIERTDAKALESNEPIAELSELPAVLANPPWHEKKRPKRARVTLPGLAMLAREERVGPIAAKWNPSHLKELELPSVAGFARFIREHWAQWYCPQNVILDVHSPALALPLAKLVDHRSRSKTVWKWIEANTDSMIVGLIPAALGEGEAPRKVAELLLRRLAITGKKQQIEAIANEYGADVRKGIDEILAWDAHYECPKTPPKLPLVCKLDAFTTPRLANGKRLPPEAVKHLVEMLAFTLPDPPYVGIEEVRAACDPRSLAELAWDMARAWEIAGAKKQSDFMLYAIAHLADDEVTRRTTPAIKDRRILDVLRLIGSEAATIELATIAARATYAPSPYMPDATGAETMLEEIARERGITKAELDDRIAPTTRLDDEGLALDFGARKFKIAFDSKLTPIAIGEDGKRSENFPAKRKTDDPAAVKRAQAKWNDLREDVIAIGLRRIASLERAMATRRTWDPKTFREVWCESPFIKPLAQAVVWTTDDGRTFRVAEDLTLSDENDRTLTLAPDAMIAVAHPVKLGAESLARWRTIFEEYELIQPFPQLDRANAGPPIEVAQSSPDAMPEIRRPPVAPNQTYALAQKLVARGYRGDNHANRWTLARPTPNDGRIEVSFMGSPMGPVSIRFFSGQTQLSCHDADPIDVFEAMRDVDSA